MAVSYYPAQKLTIGGSEVPHVQSANVDFTVSRQLVNEFGKMFPVANVLIEPPTAKLDFTYALANNSNVASTLGLNNMLTLLSDTQGKSCSLLGAGNLTLTKAFLTSYSAEGSVGNIATASASLQAIDATYNASQPSISVATVTPVVVVPPSDITISMNGSFSCRSFSFNIDIPREYINVLGKDEPEAIIVSGPAKASAEAEIILNGSDPFFDVDQAISASINCGGNIFSITNARISNFTSNATIDGVQTASVTIEAPIMGNNVSVGG